MPGSAHPSPWRRIASRNRRRIRLRTTALPIFLVTVKPQRGSFEPSPESVASAAARRLAACKTKPRRADLTPWATARNSARCFNRLILILRSQSHVLSTTPRGQRARSSRQALAAARTAASQNQATANRLGAGAETVATLAHELRRLIGPFHVSKPPVKRPSLFAFVGAEPAHPVSRMPRTGSAGDRGLVTFSCVNITQTRIWAQKGISGGLTSRWRGLYGDTRAKSTTFTRPGAILDADESRPDRRSLCRHPATGRKRPSSTDLLQTLSGKKPRDRARFRVSTDHPAHRRSQKRNFVIDKRKATP